MLLWAEAQPRCGRIPGSASTEAFQRWWLPPDHFAYLHLFPGSRIVDRDYGWRAGHLGKRHSAARGLFVYHLLYRRIVRARRHQQCVIDCFSAARIKRQVSKENHDAIDLPSALCSSVGACPATAQESSFSGDAASSYDWVHANAGPGQCGCFGLNGAGISGSWNVQGPWSLVADSGSASLPTHRDRELPDPDFVPRRRPFSDFHDLSRGFAGTARNLSLRLVGAAHAGGGSAGVGDASFGFAARVGGGIDVPVSGRFSSRAIQVDYFRPTSPTPLTIAKIISYQRRYRLPLVPPKIILRRPSRHIELCDLQRESTRV